MIDGFITGVVEDNNDPLGQGRVKVRCFEYHSEDKFLLPTQDLPWATCLLPANGGNAGGVGSSAGGLLIGSWVTGFFRDPGDYQDFVVIGSYYPGSGETSPGGVYGPVEQMIGGSRGDITGMNTYDPLDPAYVMPTDVNLTSNVASNIIAVATAEGQKGIKETNDNNRHPEIKKYWGAEGATYPSGYGSAYCAAFVSWVLKQSGVPDDVRPKTAGVSLMQQHFKKYPRIYTQIPRQQIQGGDVCFNRGSHTYVATGPLSNGRIPVVTANSYYPNRGGSGVVIKTYPVNIIKYGVRINVS